MLNLFGLFRVRAARWICAWSH